ncbi:MAG: hypothetical protein AB7F66_17705 [Bacteriovoracia bacterium]
MLPILLTALPALIGVSEKLFPGTPDAPKRGAEKKSYVLRMLEIAWDVCVERNIIPDAIKGHKDVALAILSKAIDETVEALKKK